ncbi:phosphatidate cytidylyltransferase [Gallaecimonas sp. GXIMD4217]|uniref:phosphatidate cytidylyltransferase n=1 Tax=Gallaecimonas sp. GXIMD4217 TaxID=3131927 RepID=UPI00311ADDC3
MLKQRVITALILLPLAFAAIFLLPLDGFAWASALVLALGAWEWAPLAGFASKFGRALASLAALALMALMQLLIPVSQLWADGLPASLYSLPVLLGGFWWVLAALLAYQYPEPVRFWQNHRSWRLIFGVLTLIPAWAGLQILRSWHYDVAPLHGALAILYVLLLVWAADTGAYFVGRRFGKHKLAPRVSPGKTLEGALGGIGLALLVAAIAISQAPAALSPSALVSASLFAVLASILGDLSESMLKREAGIKDSGSILPGHGGILDRIDSITAAVPVFVLVMLAMGV